MNKINYTVSGRQVIGKGTYKDLLADIKEYQDGKIVTQIPGNEKIHTYISSNNNDYSSFAGGNWNDVINLKNMKQFQNQLEEFRKHKLEEKIKSKLDFSSKRARKISEHDGDYDFEKRWEIKPFNNAIRMPVPISIVDIKVDFSISYAMSADDINKYGAMVWAVVQLIESLGIQCNINMIDDNLNIDSKGGGFFGGNNDSKYDLMFDLQIKKSGEYISPIALATCFQSVFYRRALFAGFVIGCEFLKVRSSDGIGRPREIKVNKNLWYDDGIVHTKPGGIFKVDDVVECIRNMLGVKN